MKSCSKLSAEIAIISIICLTISLQVKSQMYPIDSNFNWRSELGVVDNYSNISNKAYLYYTSHSELGSVPGNGFKSYLRWTDFWDNRVYKDRSSEPSFTFLTDALANFVPTNNQDNSLVAANWHSLGPNYLSTQNLGLIASICVDPTDVNIIYAGTNSSGVFKTTNGGQTWTCFTDNIPNPCLGVLDIQIDPSNSQIIYLCTGNTSGLNVSYGTGIYKTTDGGQTWTTIGPNEVLSPANGIVNNKLLIYPGNSQVLFLGSGTKVYRSLDQGVNWTTIFDDLTYPASYLKKTICDMELIPYGAQYDLYIASTGIIWQDQNNIYQLSNSELWRLEDVTTSTITKNNLTSTLPAPIFNNVNNYSLVERLAIAKSSAASGDVYIGYRFGNHFHLRRSSNQGSTWSSQYNESVTITEAYGYHLGGTGTWRLSLEISNSNSNLAYVGGFGVDKLNLPVTTSTPSSPTNYTHFAEGLESTTCHVDIRCLNYANSTSNQTGDIVYVGNDGGVSKIADGSNISNINGTGLEITQFYGLSSSSENTNLIVSGAQDNGQFIRYNNVYSINVNGDGYDAYVLTPTPTAPIRYITSATGSYFYSGISTYPSGLYHSMSPLRTNIKCRSNPNVPDIAYFTGNHEIIKFDYSLTTPAKTVINTPTCATIISSFAIENNNEDNIWVAHKGPVWSTITTSNTTLFHRVNSNWVPIVLPILEWLSITDIAINQSDPNIVYLTFGGFSGANPVTYRVYVTYDGGSTWSDYSDGLPGFPVNRIISLESNPGELFAATDVGVFYRNDNHGITEWIPFNENLPITIVTDLEVNYKEKKLIVSTYGRGLYETSLPCDIEQSVNIHIDTPETWSSPKRVYNDVHITSTLTITSRIEFGENVKVVVHPGAQLIINGGTLTSACNDVQWIGVEVWGDNNYSQFIENGVQHQGYLELLNNATIENAHYAVSVGDPLVWNTFGGIVKAYNSNFLNNWKSVGFMSYHNYYPGTSDPAPNQSKFENCTFEITDNFIRGDFQAQITMWDVNGIYISGCDFADNRTTVTDINRMGDGIYTLDANFTVRAICNNPNPPIPCPTQDLHRSSFSGFNNGIYASGSWKDQSVTVSQTDFEKNQRAINLMSTNNSRIVQCTMRIGKSNATNFSDCYGLYAKFATGYQVEENEFIGIQPSSFSTRGAFFEYNGANYNETYKNRYTDLNFGEVGYALNRDRTNPYIGLQFLCNFNDNESVHGNDFVSSPNNSLPDRDFHGIRDFQGDYTMSAGNRFTHDPLANVGDFANQTQNPLYYHYYTDPPIYYTNGLVFPVYLNINNLCLSRITSHDPTEKLSESEKSQIQGEIDNFKTIYANLKYVHSQLIDGGNSGALVNQIQLSWPEDIWELHDELVSKSPYLSEEVMRTAALKNTLPQAMILEICLSNPDISKNLKFQQFLAEDIPNPLPAYMIDLIKVAASGTTVRTALEGALADYHSKFAYRANKLINNQKADTSNCEITNLIPLLQNHGSLQAFYEIIDIFLSKGEWSKANDSIIILPSRFILSETQVVELDHFASWYQFRYSVHQANKSLMQLDSTEISTLVEMASAYQDWVGARIKNLLCFGYNICFDEYPQIELQKGQYSIQSNSKSEESKVKVYPNPGSAYIVFEIAISNSDETSVMTISDISGKLLEKMRLSNEKFVYLLDIREYNNGTYYYTIQQNNHITGSGKFTVTH